MRLPPLRLRHNNPHDDVNQYTGKGNTEYGYQHINDAYDGWVDVEIFGDAAANTGNHTVLPGSF